MTSGVGDALAAAAYRLGADASQVFARIGGPLGTAALAAHAELAALDAGTSKRRRAEIAAAARAPIPAGIRAVHSTWIEAALAPLPPRARTAVAAPSDDPMDLWLARWATASLPPMPSAPSPPSSASAIARLVAREPAAILEWLASLGAEQLAFALGPAAAAASHPQLAAAAARIATSPRLGKLGSQRAAIARCRGISLDDPHCFVVVGVRALASHVADDGVARLQLMHRLPRDLGLLVARELRAHADAPRDQAPELPAL